ncbi:flagellar hook-associated protein FlgK [Metapseudomonas otitidis]|uniref:flagellar hook-associated protein FlgK n=1 Tax=Metapseudomonas otitidis TaxID=319939 RepID=UPI00227D1822|nr:flagellar hook-associated protein FlgK [Pseudomonas otitidis]WAF84034.1 flagellar hook-associated protein FlgK [Pseudomonas otitidis]
MADLLYIGLSGLRSTQTSLTTTGHNISNVNTPGYSRQQTVQQTNIPQFTGGGYIGSGSQVTDVRRLASEFLTSQLRTATSQNSELQAFKSQIEQLDSLLSSTTTGISPALKSFFTSLQTASQDPASLAGREAVLSQAKSLSDTFNTLYRQFDKQNEQINSQLGALTTQINSLAASVASYNDAIAKARSNGAEPNDLLDAREEAIRQISTMVGVKTLEQKDGTLSLFIGTGQPLVVGNAASTLKASPGVNDPSRYQVELVTGGVSQIVTDQVTGGEMGGLIAYRDTALDQSYNALGQLAITISDTVNKQLGQGLDLAGRAGSPLFADINSTQAASLRVLAATTNTGTASGILNITNTSQMTSSDYRLDFDGTNFTALRLSDSASMTVTVTGTGPYTLSFADASGVNQGFQVQLSALPAAGDRFTLQPTRRGAADFGETLQSADQLAFAGSARAEATTNNRGTGTIGQPSLVNGPSPIDITDLQDLFGTTGRKLTFDSTTNTLTGTLPPGATLSYVSPSTTALTPGQTNTLRLNYTDPSTNNSYTYEFTLSGIPQSGDSFTLAFNTKGTADNRNGLALVGLQTKQTVNIGATSATYNDSYSALVEKVGALTSQVRVNAAASEAVQTQAQDSRDSLSGVSLDEEAASLIRFQQYYNANAQVIQVARALFDTLIGAFN